MDILMDREKVIEHMANAMMKYDSGAGDKTWRELARVAYYAYVNCIYNDSVRNAPDLLTLK